MLIAAHHLLRSVLNRVQEPMTLLAKLRELLVDDGCC